MNLKPFIVVAVNLCLLLLLWSVPVYAYHIVDDDNAKDNRVSGHYCGSCYKPVPKRSTAAVQPKSLTYQVRGGDTLYRISRNFGIAVSDLMLANQIVDPNRLGIGEKLSIPASQKARPKLLGKQSPYIKKVLTSTLTAYTAGVESTGKRPSDPAYGITSSGKKAKEGHTIAVDPKVIPIGSTVYIEGIGIRKAEDTGSAIKGAKIDIFMNDVKRAVKFGVKKNVKVYVLSNPV